MERETECRAIWHLSNGESVSYALDDTEAGRERFGRGPDAYGWYRIDADGDYHYVGNADDWGRGGDGNCG
jgi:hypothetical protein